MYCFHCFQVGSGLINKINIIITSCFHVTSQGKRVAFGASIGNVGQIGPFNAEITLTYKNIYSNTGAYNPATGNLTIVMRIHRYMVSSGK